MAKTYETIISVLDKFSAPIVGLEDKLGKLGNIGASTQRKLNMSPSAKLWHELTAHVGEAKSKFAELGGSIEEMGGRLAEVLPMLGAVGGAASVAGILEMAHATAEAAEALENMAKITGVSVPQLQSLDFAAKQVGVSNEQLGRGFEMMNVRIGRAAMGMDKNTAGLFHKLGISLKDSAGHVKSVADVMPQLEKAFADTKDPATRAAMAMQLFGRSGVELMPLLTEGPGKIAEMQAQFAKFGYSFSDGDLKGLEQFKSAWNEAELAIQGLTSEIGAKLAPVMAPLLTDFASFVASNRDLIALDLKDVISGIGDDLKKVDFKTISGDVKTFGGDIAYVTDQLGGMKTAFEITGGVMAVSFLMPVIEVGAAVTGLGLKMAALTLGPVADLAIGFAELVPAVTSFGEVFEALGIAMAANPLGVLALATVAAGLAVYELHKHWTGFVNDMSALWPTFGSDFHKTFDPIADTIERLYGDVESILNFGDAGNPTQGGRYGKQSLDLSGGAPKGSGIASLFKGGGHGRYGDAPQLYLNIHNPPQGMSVTTSAVGAPKPVVKTGTNGTIVNHRNQ